MSLQTANHCGTNFIYGGIGFRNCELKKYDQTVRYDESGTDMLFFDYEITVTGKIHQNDSFLVDGDEIGEKHPIFGVDTHGVANLPTAISTKQRLEAYLMQPRLKLELYIGDSRLLPESWATLSVERTGRRDPRKYLDASAVIGWLGKAGGNCFL